MRKSSHTRAFVLDWRLCGGFADAEMNVKREGAMKWVASGVSGVVLILMLNCSVAQSAPPPATDDPAPIVSGSASPKTAAQRSQAVEPTAPASLALLVGVAALVLSLAFVRGGLRRPTTTGQVWSLADATSEESTITRDGTPTTVMTASTSRLIALYGMLVILIVYLSTATIVLWDLAATGRSPSGLDKVMNFMLGGVSLFAPYAANQVRAAFESIGKKA